MRARIQQRGAYFLTVLIVGCALVVARPAQGGPVQEQKKEPSNQQPPATQSLSEQQKREAWLKERERQEWEEIRRRQAAKAAQEKQAHAPEIDGASIPTALALMGASVLLLRARLRAK